MVFGAVALALVLATVQSSFVEWTFHRYWLHRPWLPEECFRAHTLIHHQLCKFGDTFHVTEEEQEEALTFQWWGGPLLIAISMTPWLLVAWGLAALGAHLPYLAFLLAFGFALAGYYAGYEGMHYLMHKPSLPLVENSAFFKFIKRHHVIHHARMDKNLNVFLPIADFCLGSLVLEPVPAQKTSEAARKIARRHSKFGRRLEADAAPPKHPGPPGC